MPNNFYLPFAVGSGANVWTDAAYNGSSQQQTGIQKGIVPSGLMSKAWRQASVPASALAQIIVDHGLIDAPDDGNMLGFKANLRMSLAAMLAGVAFGQDTSTTANAIAVTLDPAPPSLTSFRQLYVRIANTNTGPVTIALNAIGSKTVVRHGGTPLQAGDLPAGQIAHFLYDAPAGQFVLAGLGASEVQRIVPNPVLWVRTDGSNSGPTSDGSSNDAAHAFATIDAALARVGRYSLVGTALTIRLGTPGSYAFPSGSVFAAGGTIIIQGDVTNQDNYIITGPGPSAGGSGCLDVVNASVQLFGVNLTNNGSLNHTLVAESGASVLCQNVTFSQSGTDTVYSHVFTKSSGTVTFPLGNGCKFVGSKGAMLWSGGGTINHHNLVVAGAPNFAIATVIANFIGQIGVLSGGSVTGSATGTRYIAKQIGIINTGGGGANFYPGNNAGVADSTTGGYYV